MISNPDPTTVRIDDDDFDCLVYWSSQFGQLDSFEIIYNGNDVTDRVDVRDINSIRNKLEYYIR
jgi:hypothetical protein